MSHHRRSFVRVASAAVAASIAACAGVATATAPPDSSAPADTVASPTTAAPEDVLTYPLTGMPVPDAAAYVPRPALIVKIDNVDAQPQAGLNEADIVFEEIVEGRATRFAAVFNSTDANPVGPIRSGRTQDALLFGSYNDPVFAYSGGNDGVNAELAATGWTLLTQDQGMYRDSTYHGSPHNLFGNTSDFFARAGDAGAAIAQFEYGTPTGTPVGALAMRIGGYAVEWHWDRAGNRFLRRQNGSDHDTTTGQASAHNVVVMVMPYGHSAAAAGSPEAQSVGSGRVVVYSNGLEIEGTWTRAGVTAPFVLEAGGVPIRLAPGRTWIELVDADDYSLEDTPA